MPSRKPDKPLIIIPTYNERENISRLIPEILTSYPDLHVLVIDDGSPDKTAAAVMEMQTNGFSERIFLRTRSGKLGLGTAYVDGFQWGISNGYDFLIQMDGDWSHHPKYLGEMLRLARENDFVIGSRYISKGATHNWGLGRRFLSRLGSLYSRLILGIPLFDFTGGFNGWSARVLKKINPETLKSNGYSFQVELKYRAHRLGFKWREFPIVFGARRNGKSKMSLPIALEALWRVWNLRLASAEKPPAESSSAKQFPQHATHSNVHPINKMVPRITGKISAATVQEAKRLYK